MSIQLETNLEQSLEPIQDNRYSRVHRNEQLELRVALSKIYKHNLSQQHVSLFTSGIHAIYELFINTIIKNLGTTNKIRFIVSDEIYFDTLLALKHLTSIFPNFCYERVNITNKEIIIELSERYGEEIKLLYTETCTNPSGHMPDFAFLMEIHRRYKYLIVVDNTWLSNALFNPFDFNVDGVALSLTKYYSGGRCLAGAVLGKKPFITTITYSANKSGISLSPIHCNIILDSLTSLQERVSNVSTKTMNIAQWLETHSKVNRVLYPLLPSHPSYKVNAKQLLKGGPGCLYFHISLSRENLPAQRAKTGIILNRTSYGGKDTRLRIELGDQEVEFSDQYDVAKGVESDRHIAGIWARLSVGTVATVEDIKTSLDMFLDF